MELKNERRAKKYIEELFFFLVISRLSSDVEANITDF